MSSTAGGGGGGGGGAGFFAGAGFFFAGVEGLGLAGCAGWVVDGLLVAGLAGVVCAAAESGRHATANAATSQPAREERASMDADSTRGNAGPHNLLARGRGYPVEIMSARQRRGRWR